MKKQIKKGFTLVELLVVIAIIAILSVVSVVGYTSFTKKAKVSNDVSLTNQLNTILEANETTEGKNKTPHEAIVELVDGGFDIAKFTPTTEGYNFVYDLTQNRIVLLDKSNKVESPSGYVLPSEKVNVFGIAEKQSEVNSWNNLGYSVYLKDSFKETAVTSSKGIDVGYNDDIETITYSTTDSDSVIARTNGGELIINAKNATVKHEGTSINVVVKAIKNESYHEYGNVEGTLTVESGHVEVENSGSIASIIASTPSDSTLPQPKLTTVSGSSVGTIVVNNAKTEIKVETGSKVAVVAPGKDVTLDTSKISVPSNTTISNKTVDTTNVSNFAGGVGTENSPYLINTIEQWKYLAKKSVTNGNELTCGGNYFEVNTDLDFNGINELVQIKYFAGTIDFNNHSVSNLAINSSQGALHDDCYQFLFSYLVGNSTIKNLEFTVTDGGVDMSSKIVGFINEADGVNVDNSLFEIKLENIVVNGQARYTDNNTGLFVFWAGKSNLTLKNCINYANIYNSASYTGVFVGRTYTNATTKSYCSKIEFVDCINYGMLVNTQSNGNARILVSNDSDISKTTITATGCVNYGTILAKNINISNVAAVENKGVISETTGSALNVVDNKFKFDAVSGASKYEMVFSFSGAANAGGTASVVFKLTADEITNVNAYSWVDEESVTSKTQTSQYETTVYTSGKNYVLVGDEIKLKNQPSVTVFAYDADGKVLAVYYTYSYAK